MNSQGRNQSIDVAKGVAIIAVVVIHASALLGGSDLHVSLVALSRFAVPYFVISYVFFLVKGVERRKKGVEGEVWTRFKSLLWPWFFWTTIWFAYGLWTQAPKVYDLSYWLWGGWAGQYFFFVCAQASIATCILYRTLHTVAPVRKAIALILLFVASSAFDTYLIYGSKLRVISELSYYWIWTWVPAISFGFMCTLGVLRAIPVAIARPLFLGLVGLFALQMVCSSIRLDETLVYLQPLPTAAAFVLFLQPGIFPEINLLASLGRMSLGVFCLNPILLPVVRRLMVVMDLAISGLAGVLVTSFAVVLISAFIIVCLRRVPLLYRLVSTR